MHNALTYGLLIIALFVYLFAIKVIIDDAREGFYVTMGGEMYFSQLWTIASILLTAGIIRLFAWKLWLGLPIIIVLYLVSIPLRRVLIPLFLGTGMGKKSTEESDNQ